MCTQYACNIPLHVCSLHLKKILIVLLLVIRVRPYRKDLLTMLRWALRTIDDFHLSTFLLTLSLNIWCHGLASANDINEPKLDLPLCAGLLQGLASSTTSNRSRPIPRQRWKTNRTPWYFQRSHRIHSKLHWRFQWVKRAPPTGWTFSSWWPSCRTLAAAAAPTIVILGDCWGPGPFAVQVAGEAAVRHDEVCAWRPVAYVLMFWLGLLTWVVLPSKTPASFNASMTQGVAVSGRCSPSTKRCRISNGGIGRGSAVQPLTFSRLKPLLRPVSHASLMHESRMQSRSMADAVPGRGLWLGIWKKLWYLIPVSQLS